MGASLILYTRDGCGLCETAAAIAVSAGARLTPVDIAADLDLLERYRDTIPVLKNPRSGREIGWPFDAGRVAALLRDPG